MTRTLALCTAGAILCAGNLACAAAEPAGAVSLPGPAQASFFLRLPKTDQVVFQGMVSRDDAGGPGTPMLYPMPGLAGLVAAIATHGAIVGISRNSEKSKLQQVADKVLDPYRDAIDGFSNRELMQRGMARLTPGGDYRLIEASDAAGAGWVVESEPEFTMTQDQRALVLHNTVTVRAADASASVRFRNVVKVVSDPLAENAEPETAWRARQGEPLRQESVELFAHSLRIVLKELAATAGDGPKTDKSFLYSEGGARKLERGQLLETLCHRAVVRTLRGWLMSIPARERSAVADGEAPLSCDYADRYPA